MNTTENREIIYNKMLSIQDGYQTAVKYISAYSQITKLCQKDNKTPSKLLNEMVYINSAALQLAIIKVASSDKTLRDMYYQSMLHVANILFNSIHNIARQDHIIKTRSDKSFSSSETPYTISIEYITGVGAKAGKLLSKDIKKSLNIEEEKEVKLSDPAKKKK